MRLETVDVIGGGAWGTALAQAAAMAGRTVNLVVRDVAQADEINGNRTNQRYLGEQGLHQAITASGEAIAADFVILAVPAQASRAALGAMSARISLCRCNVPVSSPLADSTTGLPASALGSMAPSAARLACAGTARMTKSAALASPLAVIA